MSNQLAVIGGAPPAIVNQRKSLFNQAAQANVQAAFAIVSYKGKNWRIKYRGEDILLTDERGLPQQALDVVVVGVASGISKQYYQKGYVEGDNAAPDCFSVNGTTPDPSSPKKQGTTCAVCPMNQWGSKITEQGTKAKACQDSRRIALVPDGDLENEAFGGPVMMRLPPTTLANFAQYGAGLDKRGAGMEYVVTRMTFDFDVAYPKIKFEPLRWLTQQEAIAIVGPDGESGICSNPVIERMLNEAVEEVAHDPAAAAAADPLAQGGPAQVFTQPAQPVDPPQAVAPVAAAAPAAPAAPAPAAPAPARGFGGATVAQQPAQAAQPAQAPRKGGFGAAPAAQPAQQAQQAQPVQQAQPAQQAPVQQPAQVVQAAPSDMEAAIDNLLNAAI